MEALEISKPYATDIRNGKRVPHPRHWEKLVQLSGTLLWAKQNCHSYQPVSSNQKFHSPVRGWA